MPDRDNVSGRGIAAGLEARGGLAAARPGSLDGLTGLPNRAAFAAILDGIFADPDRSGVALLRSPSTRSGSSARTTVRPRPTSWSPRWPAV